MRIIITLALVALSGCFINDPDGDGKLGKADCDPNSSVACDTPDLGDADTDADTDADSDADSDADTDVDSGGDTADTGDTAEPCAEFTWYRDADSDGYGDPDTTTVNCEPSPAGYVADATDCDDDDATSYPGAPEACDGADNDCDGEADESASNVWWLDYDRDGYGAGDGVEVICDGASDSLVDNDGDCDDGAAEVNPGADELCNETDDDCDGSVDEDAVDRETMWDDDDGDGYGDDSAGSFLACAADGFVTVSGDCDDTSGATYPGASESCDGADNDCDGALSADETDDDGDGFNECADADCDDASAGSYPGAPESCDGADNDCDGTVDESDAGDVATWYHDADGDGYGNAAESFTSCSAPAGYVSDSSDCDDTSAAVNPAAIEVCDGVDNDCEGSVDEAADDATVWSADADGDGYGSDTYADWLAACDQPAGYVDNFDDCDDADAAVNTSATEVDADSVDNDCDGTVDNAGVTCCADSDGDGYGSYAYTDCAVESTGICPSGYVEDGTDCDDSNSTTNPAEDDPYGDGVDSDCDGSAT